MKSPQISAGIIPYFQKNGEYFFLCIKHQRGHRGFSKGGVEPDESQTDTAIREFTEETGITQVKINTQSSFIEHFPINNDGVILEKTVTFFLGEISETEIPKIHLSSREMADYRVGNYEEILELLTYDSAKKTFREAFSYLES